MGGGAGEEGEGGARDAGTKKVTVGVISEGRASVNLESTGVAGEEEDAREAEIEQQHQKMLQLKRGIDSRLALYEKRVTGDNGEK